MIENDAFKLLLINLFHLNPDDIANILCTTFNKMMVLVVLQLLYPPSLINMWILAETHFRKSLILMRYMPLNPKRVNMSVFFLILKNRFLLMFFQIVKRNIFKLLSKDPFRRTQKIQLSF